MVKFLYKVYFWVIVIPIFAVLTILAALFCTVGCMLGGERIFAYWPGALWAKSACVLTGCRVKVSGREHIRKGQSYVFVSNHQGAFDIFLIYGYLGAPIKWMMKKSLGNIPFVGMACRKAGFIFVDHSSARAAQKSIAEAVSHLHDGYSLIVFPEGTRSRDGHLQQFKRGAFMIAFQTALPVVPVTLNGTFNVMQGNKWDIYPHRLEMVIHPPLKLPEDAGSKEASLKFVADTREIISSSLWEEYR